MTENIISITNNFSNAPAGRYHPQDGPYTGELFRTNFLVPSLRNYDITIVFLDNDSGYGSSFLEEAFGGLVRVERFSHEYLNEHLVLKAPDNNMIYVNDALADINKAAQNA